MGELLIVFQYISNNMQRYTVYLYLETALDVLGGISTHHQERIQLYLQHLVFVTPFLLSAAIVEELEPVRECCGWHTSPTAHSPYGQHFFVYILCCIHIFCPQKTHNATLFYRGTCIQ